MENQNNIENQVQPTKANYFLRILAGLIDTTLIYGYFAYSAFQNPNVTGEDAVYKFIAMIFWSLLYFAIMESAYGATFGKMIFRIKVVNNEYKKIGFGKAFLRSFVKFIGYTFSSFLIGIFVFLPIYGNGQTLTDLICRTQVIKK